MRPDYLPSEGRETSSILARALSALRCLVAGCTALSAMTCALLATTFLVAPTPAHATNGQCLWEGGPGAPTYQACLLEDCMGAGGYAQCIDPVIKPSSGFNESQNAALTFSATAGQSVTLTMSGLSITPAGTMSFMGIFNANQSYITGQATTTGATLTLTDLAAGTYIVWLANETPATGSMQVQLTYH
jgi:hypothetical protein